MADIATILGLRAACRPFDIDLRAHLDVPADAADWQAFKAVREAKDRF